MPKSATKAAQNVFYLARMEAATCNDRLASREGASEEIGIDRTRLARIELGSLTPYPEEVLLMAEAYGAPQLTNHYCSTCCPLGKETIPPCELLQIDRLTVQVLDAMRGASFIQGAILDVAGDGKVTAEEISKLERVRASLEEMEKASMALRIWIEKYIK